MAYKLGLLKSPHDDRTLKMSSYIKDLPKPPDSFNWTDRAHIENWGMMRNDKIGNCTCAMMGHLIMMWTALTGQVFIPSDDEIVKAYSDITGYDPVTGANDNGANELDVMKYMRTTGIAGHKLGAFVGVNHHNHDEVKAAIWLFGGSGLGVWLPQSAEEQKIWAFPPVDHNQRDPTAGSWGGHAAPALGYNKDGIILITWGQPLFMTWAFWDKYIEEAWAMISPDFVTGTKPAPNGFNMDQLVADLKQISY